MIWFTSDTHFGHRNVLEYSRRPWATVEEMDEALIANWNARVGPRDEVWHLGDFCFAPTPEAYRTRLNGRIHLVLGNHDRRRLSLLDANRLFSSIQDVKYLRWNGQRFWLSHYAHRTWPKSGKGTFHLFGHSHGDLPGHNRSMDVGVDAIGCGAPTEYTPIDITEVVATLTDRPRTLHHTERTTGGLDAGVA